QDDVVLKSETSDRGKNDRFVRLSGCDNRSSYFERRDAKIAQSRHKVFRRGLSENGLLIALRVIEKRTVFCHDQVENTDLWKDSLEVGEQPSRHQNKFPPRPFDPL